MACFISTQPRDEVDVLMLSKKISTLDLLMLFAFVVVLVANTQEKAGLTFILTYLLFDLFSLSSLSATSLCLLRVCDSEAEHDPTS